MIKYIKNETKHLPFVLILLALLYGTVTYATNYLFNSNEDKHNSSTSGIQKDNVQGTINDSYACASDYAAYDTRLTNIENKIYPVGSIYIGVSSTNPSTLFGGTWEAFATGRTLVGYDSSDTDFNAVEKTGGAKTVTLAAANIPKHRHSFTPAGTVSKPTFTGTAVNTGNQSADHTHTVTDYYANGTSGSTTIDFSNGHAQIYVNGTNNRLYYKELTGLTRYNANYYMQGKSASSASSSGSYGTALTGSQAHTHTVSNTSASRTTSANSANHYHSVTAAGSVSQPSFTGTAGNTDYYGGDSNGNTTAFSVQNKYITVYMWKRTA